jgi:hypothetical protein
MKLWIARDKNGALALYTEEPMLYYNSQPEMSLSIEIT